MTRVEQLKQDCEAHGFFMAAWSPGDGVTRYRFFSKPGNDYFGPDNGDFTALGWKEATAYIAGRTRVQ